MNYEGKVAIITGSSRGIGAACAKLLGLRGARVVVNYLRDADRAEQVVAAIRASGGEAIAIQADVHQTTEVNRLVSIALETYQRIDILVSNAPSAWVEKSFQEIEWPEMLRVLESEMKATFDVTKAVLPAMIAQKYGRLIYMVSDLARHPVAGAIASGTAKAAVISFVRYLAKELGEYGITANAVAPGLVETEMNQYMPQEIKQQIAELTPLQRLCQPDDVAGVVAFLASEDSKFMTGGYLPISGGLTME